MKISCSSIDDFLANLDDGVRMHRYPFQRRIYVQNTHQPMNVEGTSLKIFLSASCVLPLDDDGAEGMVEYGEECGIDRRSSDRSSEGSDRRNALLGQLKEWAAANDVVLLPGLLSM